MPAADKLPDTPSFSLEGRRAVVTGASRGIGLAAAAALSQAGAEVTLIARSQDQLEAAAEAIRKADGKAHAIVLDVSNIAAVHEFFEQRPAFDILVNNAGTNRTMPIMDATEEDYDTVVNLNLKSAFFVAQACLRKMIADEVRGSLIHTGSQMGHVGGPNRTLYCASKWGLEGMNKALALDVAKFGIRSNTLAPTFIETPLTRPFFEDKDFLASILQKIKLGRIGQVNDIMGAIVFLASDASALMTGSSIVIDGGWTAD